MLNNWTSKCYIILSMRIVIYLRTFNIQDTRFPTLDKPDKQKFLAPWITLWLLWLNYSVTCERETW